MVHLRLRAKVVDEGITSHVAIGVEANADLEAEESRGEVG